MKTSIFLAFVLIFAPAVYAQTHSQAAPREVLTVDYWRVDVDIYSPLRDYLTVFFHIDGAPLTQYTVRFSYLYNNTWRNLPNVVVNTDQYGYGSGRLIKGYEAWGEYYPLKIRTAFTEQTLLVGHEDIWNTLDDLYVEHFPTYDVKHLTYRARGLPNELYIVDVTIGQSPSIGTVMMFADPYGRMSFSIWMDEHDFPPLQHMDEYNVVASIYRADGTFLVYDNVFLLHR